VAANYGFRTRGISHQVNAMVGSNLTTPYQAGIGDRTYTMLGAGVLETIAEQYTVAVSYNRNASSIVGAATSAQDIINYSVGTTALLKDLRVQVNGMISSSSEPYAPSTRTQHSLSAHYGYGFDIQGTLEAGWSHYTQTNTSVFNYDEYFLDLRLAYRFSY
jgi:hypothetical protein